MAGITEEAGKAVSGVVTAIGGAQPLALALVVMNIILLGYMFYVQSSSNKQRQETVGLVIQQQTDTEKLLANCVSVDVSRNMMDNMQKITETMLAAEQKEITRMQGAIDNERNRSFELRQREQRELDDLKKKQPQPQSQPQDQPPRMQRLSGATSFIPLPPLPDTPVLHNMPPIK